MNSINYLGLDVHKKTISYCLRQADGTILREGRLKRRARLWPACRQGCRNRGSQDWKRQCFLPGSTITYERRVGR